MNTLSETGIEARSDRARKIATIGAGGAVLSLVAMGVAGEAHAQTAPDCVPPRGSSPCSVAVPIVNGTDRTACVVLEPTTGEQINVRLNVSLPQASESTRFEIIPALDNPRHQQGYDVIRNGSRVAHVNIYFRDGNIYADFDVYNGGSNTPNRQRRIIPIPGYCPPSARTQPSAEPSVEAPVEPSESQQPASTPQPVVDSAADISVSQPSEPAPAQAPSASRQQQVVAPPPPLPPGVEMLEGLPEGIFMDPDFRRFSADVRLNVGPLSADQGHAPHPYDPATEPAFGRDMAEHFGYESSVEFSIPSPNLSSVNFDGYRLVQYGEDTFIVIPAKSRRVISARQGADGETLADPLQASGTARAFWVAKIRHEPEETQRAVFYPVVPTSDVVHPYGGTLDADFAPTLSEDGFSMIPATDASGLVCDPPFMHPPRGLRGAFPVTVTCEVRGRTYSATLLINPSDVNPGEGIEVTSGGLQDRIRAVLQEAGLGHLAPSDAVTPTAQEASGEASGAEEVETPPSREVRIRRARLFRTTPVSGFPADFPYRPRQDFPGNSGDR